VWVIQEYKQHLYHLILPYSASQHHLVPTHTRMASTTNLPLPPNQDRLRIRSPSPQNPVTRPSAASTSKTRQSSKSGDSRRYSSTESKENEPLNKEMASPRRMNGRLPSEELEMNGKANGHMEGEQSTIRARRAAASPGAAKRQLADPVYNGLPTLPTIGDDDDVVLSSGPSSPTSGRPPPPAPSARAGSDPNYGSIAGSGTRKRRSSSIKRKLSPGVTPQKAVDWEIPRKAFHSSIGKLILARLVLSS
jgi:diacylglycerol kinase (CTP)